MRRRIAVGLVAVAGFPVAGGAPAHAAPALDDLRARDRALAREEVRLAARLAHQRASLASTRARIESLRRRYDSQTALVTARLRAAYARPGLDPVVALLAGDPEEARARAALLRAVASADARLLRAHRDALDDLREAEATLERRKRGLAAEGRLLAARRATVRARIRAERRALASRAVDVAGARVPDAPAAGPAPGGGRGLPAEILRDRTLPGAPPVDAATGLPVLLDPPRAGAPLTIALPGQGIVPVTAPALSIPGPRRFQAAVTIRSPEAASRTTASGIRFTPDSLAAAHRTLPLGTLLRLRRGPREVVVRVIDRGPFVASRDLEVSVAAAVALGMRRADAVRAEVLG